MTYTTPQVAKKIGVRPQTLEEWLLNGLKSPRKRYVDGAFVRLWEENDLERAREFSAQQTKPKRQQDNPGTAGIRVYTSADVAKHLKGYLQDLIIQQVPKVADASVPMTTDNGTQFTSTRFIETLNRLGITHRRTAYHHSEGNSYIERFHRSLKEEEVWTAEYRSLEEGRASIARWIEEYNHVVSPLF